MSSCAGFIFSGRRRPGRERRWEGRTSVMSKELSLMASKALPFMEFRGERPVAAPRLQFSNKLVELRKASVWYSVRCGCLCNCLNLCSRRCHDGRCQCDAMALPARFTGNEDGLRAHERIDGDGARSMDARENPKCVQVRPVR